MGGLCPLFFDGAVCQFNELPKPNDEKGIKQVYDYLGKIRNKGGAAKSFLMFARKVFNKLKYKK